MNNRKINESQIGRIWNENQSVRNLSYDTSIANSTASSPHRGIQCFLFQFPEHSLLLRSPSSCLRLLPRPHFLYTLSSVTVLEDSSFARWDQSSLPFFILLCANLRNNKCKCKIVVLPKAVKNSLKMV